MTKSKMLPCLPEEKSNQACFWSFTKKDGVFSLLNGDRPLNSRPARTSFTRRPTTSDTGRRAFSSSRNWDVKRMGFRFDRFGGSSSTLPHIGQLGRVSACLVPDSHRHQNASFRGASAASEPGIQTRALCRHLDSGSGPAGRPEMTAILPPLARWTQRVFLTVIPGRGP